MKLYKRIVFTSPSLPSQPIPFRLLRLPLREALAELRIIRVHEGEIWLVADVPEVRTLMSRGVSRAHIWTAGELESLPWDEEPISLCSFRQATSKGSQAPQRGAKPV